MNIGLFSKKKTNQNVIWSISVQPELQAQYKLLAQELRIPMSIVAGDALQEWMVTKGAYILMNPTKKNAYADLLVKKYMTKKETSVKG